VITFRCPRCRQPLPAPTGAFLSAAAIAFSWPAEIAVNSISIYTVNRRLSSALG